MLVEHVEGKPLDEVKRFSAEDMLKLFGAKLTPNRQKCCLLSWRVLQQALYAPVAAKPENGAKTAELKPTSLDEAKKR
jgi:nitrogen fixation NifU-like protein